MKSLLVALLVLPTLAFAEVEETAYECEAAVLTTAKEKKAKGDEFTLEQALEQMRKCIVDTETRECRPNDDWCYP